MDVLKQIKEKNEQDKLNRRIVKASLPMRKEAAHKGDFGKVLIIAGSEGMCGAACLCAGAALRTGSGLTRVSVPEELFTIVQISVPEATCIDRERLTAGAFDYNEYDAIAIGPGLGISEDAKKILSRLFTDYKGPVVIDADGLNNISESEELLSKLNERALKYETVITPHPGEAKRLLSAAAPAYDIMNMSREETAEALVRMSSCTVLYKGHDTIIARRLDGYGSGEEEVIIEMVKNTTGNPGMATGGSGDVLTGIIVSLLGQSLNAFASARAGAYIHGLSGDLAAKEYGEAGLIAGDLVKYVAYAIKAIQE